MIDVFTGVSVGALALAASAIAWVWIRFEGMIARERAAREQLERDFMAYQRSALEKFATPGAIEKTEARLAAAIEKMTVRLEVVIGRIEALSNDLTRVAAGRSLRKPALREVD